MVGVFERPRDFLESLISSVAVNTLKATFLHLSLLFLLAFAGVRVTLSLLSAPVIFISSVCCLPSPHLQQMHLFPPLHLHAVHTVDIWNNPQTHSQCLVSRFTRSFSIGINTSWDKFHVFPPMVV